ncbi:MATE family efflux transporter [Phenylobacterium sp. LjRoot225]|uniref:MATE family efflux transporter n=1 Tax=Phenylobacterium sp. LjRoot225 TaxID=3342285 RepID=UPI003ECD6B25
MRDGALQRTILAIALPAMLTSVATALFGLADMWVIGRLGDAVAQGAVEVGAKLLMTLLIVFNFLRSSTVALTAQAAGRDVEAAQAEVLVRALVAAAAIGALLLLAMPVVIPAGLRMFSATGPLASLAQDYVAIRYWGGLPWLFNAVLTGWLIGRRRVRAVLVVEVAANLFHILLDLGLVLGLGLGVAGVAIATLSSEAAKLVALAAMAARERPARSAVAVVRARRTWDVGELGRLLRLNRDLFGRTLLLMTATVLLTRAGAQQGAVVLAANAILYQLFILSALLLDGFETAAQVLCGEALGAGRKAEFKRLVRAVLISAGVVALAIALVYALAGPRLAASFSTMPAVVATAHAYIGWAALLPLVGVASFVFDGVFIGSSWTRAMLLSMGWALAGFLVLLVVARPWGNHGVWLAFSLFFLLRGVGQAILLPGLVRRSFASLDPPPEGEDRSPRPCPAPG